MKPEGQACVVSCLEGQSVGPETGGHCCWPGQVWSNSRSVCVGIPQCGAGFVVQGDVCVKGEVAPAPPPPPPVPPAAVAPPADETKPPTGFHEERHFRGSLIIAGGVTLGVGWLMSIAVSIGGFIYSAAVPANTCWSSVAAVGWVPFIGPSLAIGGLPAHHAENGKVCTEIPLIYAPGVAVSVVSTVAQLAGAALMVLGFTWRTHEMVPDEQHAARAGDELEWGVHLGTAGAPLGLTFSLSKF
jgi:hypothetical protein